MSDLPLAAKLANWTKLDTQIERSGLPPLLEQARAAD
jgi:hypothetical protein